MEIGKYSYKGFDYTVEFTNGEGGEIIRINSLLQVPDEFLKDKPQTVEELVDKLSELLVWTSCEDCHFDTSTAKLLIEDFIKTIKQ